MDYCSIPIITVLVLVTAILYTFYPSYPTVRIGCENLIGKYHTDLDVYSFRGVRYSQPPIGSLRWKPPVPMATDRCETVETVYTQENPPPCFQAGYMSMETYGSEDCLFLNIYTPSLDKNLNLPVLVFLHGGFLLFGSGYYLGATPVVRTARDMGAVVVTVQYRLNAFGFLVTEADDGHGNYGFLDQALALRWIRDNIRNFGGDPNKVTLSGFSAGGSSVLYHLTSPRSKGLFHQALVMSAFPTPTKTLSEARKQNRFFLERTGCHNITCLQQLSPEDVIQAIYPAWDIYLDTANLPTYGLHQPALMVVNDDDMMTSPYQAFNTNMTEVYSDVPVLIGNSAQDIDYSPAPDIVIKSWNKQDLYEYTAKHLDPFDPSITSTALNDLYNVDRDAEYIFTTMASDIRYTCGTHALARRMAEILSSPVYRYMVTYTPSHDIHPFGFPFPAKYATHGVDLYAWFDQFIIITAKSEPVDYQFYHIIQSNLKSFIHNGRPDDMNWAPYPGLTALINETVEFIQDDFNARQCQFWFDKGFMVYSWLNF